jgi:hypothetical protein
VPHHSHQPSLCLRCWCSSFHHSGNTVIMLLAVVLMGLTGNSSNYNCICLIVLVGLFLLIHSLFTSKILPSVCINCDFPTKSIFHPVLNNVKLLFWIVSRNLIVVVYQKKTYFVSTRSDVVGRFNDIPIILVDLSIAKLLGTSQTG